MLSIEAAHVSELKTVPILHTDPFDRMLISQSRVEELPLLTVDHLIQQLDGTGIAGNFVVELQRAFDYEPTAQSMTNKTKKKKKRR